MKIAFTNLVLLISLIFCGSANFAQDIQLIKRIPTKSEFLKLKDFVGTYEEGKNYNIIIKGRGTGLRPPTEEQWKEMRNQSLLIDRIEFPSGITEIPASHDNSATIWFPPIGHQGSEGSCVPWACAYYAKTFQEAKEHNWDLSGCLWEEGSLGHPSSAYQDKIFSPAFVYNQVNWGKDNGSGFANNILVLENIGCCTWNRMPYNSNDYLSWPGEDAWRQAPWYRSKSGYGWYVDLMWFDTDTGIQELKQFLASGNLVVISVNAVNYYNMTREDLWLLENYNPSSTNHANTVVGYDDNYGPYIESGKLSYGAFKVANSWGVGGWEHVKDGFYYITYECMKQRVRYANFFQNLENYIPQIVAVFEMNHNFRSENLINFGIGDTISPTFLKSLSKFSTEGGSSPFPNNPIVLDITEFGPFMSSSDNRIFMKVYDSGTSTTGTIHNFAVEMYDDYSSQIPAKIYKSDETPISTQHDKVVYVYANVPANPERIVITKPLGGEVFDIESNPVITYNSAGTSGYVNIDYSTDKGATWNTIASNVIDNGNYIGWIVPNTPSPYCKIRVSDVDGIPSAVSQGLFRIGQHEFLPISLPVINAITAAWGDYDNDGDLDLLLAGCTGSECKTRIYRNNGDDIFEDQTQIVLTNGDYISAAWGDYDNDGDLDILLAGYGGNNNFSKIYRNNGNNSFEQITVSLQALRGGATAWGDYDNDGDLDILLTGTDGYNNFSKIYKNNGNSTFTLESSAVLTGVCNASASLGDYDNDGNLDILLTGYTGSNVISKIYKNIGNNTFEQQSIGLIKVSHGSAAWGDYDNDGNLDILLTGGTGNSVVSKIYRNNQNNSFTEQTSVSLTGVHLSSAAWGDYNNDGDLDILLTGAPSAGNPISKIYRNNGDNTFTEQTAISLLGDRSASAAWGDYDNDGDLDILMAGNSKIYCNYNKTPNTRPSAPSNLKAAVDGNDVTFSWDKSIDSETPQNGLTYNLVVGTSPGACDILSPMSDLNTGKRRIVSMGNAGHCNSWTIKNLHDGHYYWSVQAIDNCFAGSEFAPEQVVDKPLPVELTSFNARIMNNAIKLAWQTATEIDNYGFEIEKQVLSNEYGVLSKPQSNWKKIGFVEGNGNSSSPKNYEYVDKNPIGGSKFVYRLKQIDTDGTFEYSEELEAELLPKQFELFQNYPNPFNPQTVIRYGLPADANVNLVLYDVLGNKIMTLIEEKKEAGTYEVTFDGSGLANGIYIYMLQAGNSIQTKKMVLLK